MMFKSSERCHLSIETALSHICKYKSDVYVRDAFISMRRFFTFTFLKQEVSDLAPQPYP